MGSTEIRLDTVSSRPEPTAREYHTVTHEVAIVAAVEQCVVTEKTPATSGARGRQGISNFGGGCGFDEGGAVENQGCNDRRAEAQTKGHDRMEERAGQKRIAAGKRRVHCVRAPHHFLSGRQETRIQKRQNSVYEKRGLKHNYCVQRPRLEFEDSYSCEAKDKSNRCEGDFGKESA